MKKYLGFIAPGLDGDDSFWKNVRLAPTLGELFAACDRHLSDASRPFADPLPA
jgi:hypothetical protein